ncbi:MAG: hypothetical protein K1X56_03235 [Flavobacteriales bacterium]|nr:hypothetical protein [Flavobacteriales bacterium]
MKTKVVVIAIALLAAPQVKAQKLLKKLAESSKPKEEKVDKTPVQIADMEGDFKDEFGYSGKYYSLDTLWKVDINYGRPVLDEKGRKQFTKVQTWKFIREENGQIINRLDRFTGVEIADRGYGNFRLVERMLEKGNIVCFSKDGGSNGNSYLLQLEKDVYGLAKVDIHKNLVLEYQNTYAKDPAKLEAYDKEIGAAKMQQIMNQYKQKEFDILREKWMKNPTYAAMAGKIGFMDDYRKVAYNRNEITEKTDAFATSFEIGKQSIFYRAYFKTPGAALCPGCELNNTYEMEGFKISRIELRKKASKWSRMIKQKFVEEDFFTAAPILVSFSENIADYAFLYCIYQNKDKFVHGKALKLKVTMTSNQDGVDKDVLAEGTISLLYKNENKDGFDKMMKWVEDVINE